MKNHLIQIMLGLLLAVFVCNRSLSKDLGAGDIFQKEFHGVSFLIEDSTKKSAILGSVQHIDIEKRDTFFFNNHIYNTSGIYLDTLNSYLDDDSIVTTYLTVYACIYRVRDYAIFTPNCDDYNDTWGIEIDDDVDYCLIVMNRWGVKVFETYSDDYVWNGIDQKDGSLCPDGSYYYVFTYRIAGHENEPQIRKKGVVYLIRSPR